MLKDAKVALTSKLERVPRHRSPWGIYVKDTRLQVENLVGAVEAKEPAGLTRNMRIPCTYIAGHNA